MSSKKILRKLISGLTITATFGCLIFGMTGCGSERDTGRNANIELVSPVGVAESCVSVSYRDIYSSEVHSALVCPSVTEYSYSSTTQFASYKNMPGQTVSSGDSLIAGNTESIDKQIENLQKSLTDLTDNYNDTMEDLNKELSEAEKEMNEKSEALDKLKEDEPVKKDGVSDTDFSLIYSAWEAQVNDADGAYRFALIDYEKKQQSIKETEELYELDYNYSSDNLKELKQTRSEMLLCSDIDGQVVACGFYSSGDYVSGGTSAAAVGDFNVKEIKCEFINKGIINKAEDIYAIADGVRYEVEYQAIDSDEYDRLLEQNGAVYSTFILEDEDCEVQVGDFVTIVIVKESRKNVLCVPKSAVSKDENGNFVYAYDGSAYSPVYIKTGLSDGLYTEVLSGLAEGDTVKSEMSIEGGENEAVLTMGSVSGQFSGDGYLYYPSTKWITNEVEYGTIYLDEICVSKYEQVEEGQVLARIHVVSDDIEIARQERLLLRQREYIAKLVKEDADRSEDEKQNTDAIEDAQEYADDLAELIADMKSDGQATEIVATVTGIVTDVMSGKSGDLLPSGSKIAQIADETQCFVMVDDEDDRLNYGNAATVTYIDSAGNTKTAQGTVVTVNSMALSGNLAKHTALVQLPAEAIAEMAGSNRNSDGWWSRSHYTVTATIRSVDNVLLVPKKAVTESGGSDYVTVKNENGQLERISFIAGGSDSSYYWVAEGLTEGMTVCWE